MKLSMRMAGLLALTFALIAGPVFGQGLSPKRIWTLTVAVNAPGAVIYVDNVLVQGNSIKVTGGAHNVKVHADGYYDFNGPVVVTGHMTFPVQLVPAGVPLTIRVPVPGARVFVDGTDVTGTVPLVTLGPHTVQVSAPGFQDSTTTVNVAGPMTLDVALQPALTLVVNVNVPGASISVDNVLIQGNAAYVSRGPHVLRVHADGYADYVGQVNVKGSMTFNVRLNPLGFPLTVNANVNNAAVLINGAPKGPVPYSEYLPPGTYAVRVTAPGYAEYSSNVTLSRAVTLNVQLIPQTSLLAFVIPPAFRDPDLKPGEARGRVKIFVDNNLVNPNGEMERIPVAPGRHRIRVASGAFSLQAADIVVQPGMSYVIEVSMDMQVRTIPTPP